MKNKFKSSVKLLLTIIMLLPVLGNAQTKNVISTHRVFPKMDKVLEFEKGLAAHAQKYHTGDVSWRVFSIQSGPDAGGYHISEGPTSWEGEDKRGDLGDEHTLDWNKNVSAYLSERQSAGYFVYIDSLSSVAIDDHSDKINITHVYPKVGKGEEVSKMIANLKKTWVAAGASVAVYSSNSSGRSQYALVTRYKQGLKEKEAGFRAPFKETYESIHGKGSYDVYMKNLAENVDESWSELLFLRTDLSSK